MNEVVAELDRSDFEDSEDDLDGYLDMKSDDEACHRNFGPGNFGPGDQNFQWKIGPAGPIFSGKMVRLWKIGPNNGPSISALVTSDCCG